MTDVFTAYRGACEGAVLFDICNQGKVQLTGKDAAAFLHNLCTNDVKRLAPGEGCEAFFTNAKARIIAYAWVQCVELEVGVSGYWLDVPSALGKTLFDHLNHYLISEVADLTDCTQELGEFHVAGPRAKALVNRSAGADRAVRAYRHDRIAAPGYDLLFPTERKSGIFQELLQEGAVPGDAATFEVLRIEAGRPAHGAEIDDTRLAMEVGRTAQAISYAKGCYLGQETIVMARDRGHVNRTLLGLRLTGDTLPAPGVKVFRGEEEIGQVTSSAFSPRAASTLALAFLRRGHQQPGTAVAVAAENGRQPAEVAMLPFVAHNSAQEC